MLCYFHLKGNCPHKANPSQCSRPHVEWPALTYVQREAYKKWRDANRGKVPPAAPAPGKQGSQHGLSQQHQGTSKGGRGVPALCISFLQGECTKANCRLYHDKSARGRMAAVASKQGGTITVLPNPKPPPKAKSPPDAPAVEQQQV